MKRTIHFITFMLLLLALCSNAQDSIRIDSKISVETKGQHNLAILKNSEDCWNCKTGKIEDNPFFHLAIYTGLNHKLILNEKYVLETGLYLEERSHSGGNNTLSNLVAFPKILLSVEDTIKLFNNKIGFSLKGGDFWNEDIEDFLRIYNIDYQALLGKIWIKNWSLQFMTIGDLSQNIGLDLHQTYRFSFGYKNKRIRNLTSLTINELFSAPRGAHPTESDINISNYIKYFIDSDLSVEGQFQMRHNPELSNSIALGLKLNYGIGNFDITSSLRYYDSDFNYGYNGDEPRYYGFGSRYLGTQLYALKNYYRDFSQWALYTHFTQSDLIAFSFTSNWDRGIYKKLGVFYSLDVNYLVDLSNNKGFLFPIYNAGLQVNFLKNFNGRISLTNKHMELRDFYQTFSVSKQPYLSLGVNMELNNIHLGTRYMKNNIDSLNGL